MAVLDDLDYKILDLVQHNNQLTTEVISRRVGLSPSAVQRRLKRLRRNRTIEFDASGVSPHAVGVNFTAIVGIKLVRESPQLFKQFKEVVAGMSEVMQCYYVTGDKDLFLVVTARDLAEYNSFLRRLAEQFPHISGLDTSVVLERFKMSVAIPLLNRAQTKVTKER
jgi:Lrp/AsnC family leucine-responsive transcriptional regulator